MSTRKPICVLSVLLGGVRFLWVLAMSCKVQSFGNHLRVAHLPKTSHWSVSDCFLCGKCLLIYCKQKAGQFLDCLRNNLMDIGLDPWPYGTHSFWCGGAQYLHLVHRMPVVDVCKWGGWSKDLEAQCTVFKYLLSWNDTSQVTCQQMLHPNPPLRDQCQICHRSCNCHWFCTLSSQPSQTSWFGGSSQVEQCSTLG